MIDVFEEIIKRVSTASAYIFQTVIVCGCCITPIKQFIACNKITIQKNIEYNLPIINVNTLNDMLSV